MLVKDFVKEIKADRIILGDIEKPIKKVATCMVITPEVFNKIREYRNRLTIF